LPLGKRWQTQIRVKNSEKHGENEKHCQLCQLCHVFVASIYLSRIGLPQTCITRRAHALCAGLLTSHIAAYSLWFSRLLTQPLLHALFILHPSAFILSLVPARQTPVAISTDCWLLATFLASLCPPRCQAGFHAASASPCSTDNREPTTDNGPLPLRPPVGHARRAFSFHSAFYILHFSFFHLGFPRVSRRCSGTALKSLSIFGAHP
jgi:hypothetical protein